MTQEKTHFGFKDIPTDQKVKAVKNVFDSVADKYDIMNDVMSVGLHRLWKKTAIEKCTILPNYQVLDLAAGTCDLSQLIAAKLSNGQLISSDINSSMLSLGRDKMWNKGKFNNLSFGIANAEKLPFADNSFDVVTIGFGLRNVTDKQQAINEIYRVLKPNGMMMILEFTKLDSQVLQKAYDFYSFKVLPKMGELVANDRESYQYLAESIRMHPNQETLKLMIIETN